MNLSSKFHLIGVAGIGMSALAKLLRAHHYEVSGSDLTTKGEVDNLKACGVTIYHKHVESNVKDSDTIVIYSTAISENNPEIEQAKSLKCPLWHRSELLRFLMESHKSLAVAGTHGKTTTSALLTHVLLTASLDPTYVIGGILVSEKTNSAIGKGEHFVLEADESDGTLIQYHPSGAICLNIEEDHLDYHYRDLQHIKTVFHQFINQVKQKELFFWCKDCPTLTELNLPGHSYGFNSSSDYRILNYQPRQTKSQFDMQFKESSYKGIDLNMMGKQNALNAASVFGLCLQLGVREDLIRKAFKTFEGIGRRSEHLGDIQNISLYDDYAHHPTEVRCTLKAFRKAFPKRRLIAIFQPHRYSRIKYFKEEFSKSFKKASEVWLLDVYSAGEKSLEDFSIESFQKEIKKQSDVIVRYVKKEELTDILTNELKPFDVAITMGAGDVTFYGREALKELEFKKPTLKIGVLFGGQSPEHNISKISKKYVLKGLEQSHFEAQEIYIDLEGYWSQGPEFKKSKEKLSGELYKKLMDFDFVFPVFHGPNGEDGMFAAFFEALSIPFAGPNSKSCALTIDKVWTKRVVQEEGIEVGQIYSFNQEQWRRAYKTYLQQIEQSFSYPMVIKPNRLGSSIGISFVQTREELILKANELFAIDDVISIEECVQGREFEILLLDTDKVLCPRPGEIISEKRRYNYESKYSSDPIIKIAQAKLTETEIEMCQKKAKRIYRALRMSGCLRIDFFISKEGKFIFGEANPMPGMTPRSLFPRMLEAHGLTPQEIMNYLVVQGLYDHRQRQQKARHYLSFAQSLQHVTE